MTRADNTHHLKRAAAARHEATTARARAALEHLDRTGQPVTVTRVAEAANVSRSWLYTQPELFATITRLRGRVARSPSVASPVPATQRATLESLRQRLDATRQDVNRLRAENATLHEQLARALGQQRARR